MTKIYFRADGNSQIGLGHVFRSLALAEMLRSDFDCIFMIRTPSQDLKKNIQKSLKIIELAATSPNQAEASHLAEKYFKKNDIVVLDGYHFTSEYQKIIKSKGAKLVSIDDIYSSFFFSDLIINHAGGITKDYYKNIFYTQFRLGLNYLLLRKEFLLTAQEPYKKKNNANIFICMGGADANNDTIDVLKDIEKKTPAKAPICKVVVGQAYKHQSELAAFIKKTKLKVEVLTNLSAREILDTMQVCSTAICPPSSVSFEYLCSGGVLYLQQTADNQKDVKKYLLQEGLALEFKQAYPVQYSECASMFERQKSIIDGKSHLRLLKAFKLLEKEAALSIEEASEKHLMQYYNWANEPSARQNAFNPAFIPLADHQLWYKNRLQSKDALLLYFHNNSQPIGQVRFEINAEKCAIISFSVDPHQGGMGYGTAILKMAILYAIEKKFCFIFEGYVKVDNMASRTIFKKLSFTETYEEEKNYFSYKLELPFNT